MEASLYLHVPFCAGACGYCDFYSVPARSGDARLEPFVDALLAAARETLARERVGSVPSVYVGGGTPSLLGPRLAGKLLDGLRAALPNVPAETTVEANPESCTPDFIRACGDSGATRLSLGVQSRNPAARQAVGRLGEASAAEAAVERARRLFRGGLSLDLISGLPCQSEASLLDDVRFAAESGADHVSLYALTVEDGTPLGALAARGEARLPSPDDADTLWIAGRDALEAFGFPQYEVSNFSRPGKESLHNRRYWRMESYLGCGPGAVGTVVDERSGTAVRHSWPADAAAWLSADGTVRAPAAEAVPRRDFLYECLIMGFRTLEGVDDSLFSGRFGAPVGAFVGASLGRRRERGLARTDRPALNREGLLTLNAFLVECLEELDETYPRYEDSRR